MAHVFPSPGQPDCSPRAARRGHLHETPRVSQRRHLVRSAESLLSPPSSYSPPVIPPPPSPAPAPAPAIVGGAVEAERDLDREVAKHISESGGVNLVLLRFQVLTTTPGRRGTLCFASRVDVCLRGWVGGGERGKRRTRRWESQL